MPTLSIRWIDDSPPNFQTAVKKATTSNGGATWTDLGTIYDSGVHPPAGWMAGGVISDILVGVPNTVGYVINLEKPGTGQSQFVYVPNDSNPTPIVVDPTNKPEPNGGFGAQRSFWVDSNGTLWLVGLSPVLHTVTVYKSTNNGLTWTLMDSAHAILAANVGNWYWDIANTAHIQFIVADGSGFMALQEFDTATGLYGAVHDPNVALGTGWSLGQVVSFGTTIAVQYAAATSPFRASLAIFSGSWNNVGQISTDTFLCSAAIDASGNSYLVHGHEDAFTNPVMTASVYSSAGTHIGDLLFPSGSTSGDLLGSPTDAVQQPYTDTSSGNIIFPTRCFIPSEANGAMFLTPIGMANLSGPFPVQATTLGQFYGGQITIDIPGLSVPCPTQTTGTVGVPFNATITATGGTPPYTYALAPGSLQLPPGLSISSSGVISGVPTTAGSYVFQIQVTDSTSATALSPICTIIISPSGGGGGGVPNPPPFDCASGEWSVFEGTAPPIPPLSEFIEIGRGIDESFSGVPGGTPAPPTVTCTAGQWSVFEGTTPPMPADLKPFVTIGRAIDE